MLVALVNPFTLGTFAHKGNIAGLRKFTAHLVEGRRIMLDVFIFGICDFACAYFIKKQTCNLNHGVTIYVRFFKTVKD